jgi:hypothetical protein
MRSYQVVELGHTLRDAAPRSHAVTAICAKRTPRSTLRTRQMTSREAVSLSGWASAFGLPA